MKISTILFAASSTLLVAGCKSPSKTDNADFFTPASDNAALTAYYDRQAAAATHADPSLSWAHFTGANLNSLGTAKLDSLLICSDRPAAVTQIYLTGGADTAEHRSAVTKYLNCHGCSSDQFTFVDGANASSYTMASHSLSDLDHMSNSSSGSDSLGGATTGAGPAR